MAKVLLIGSGRSHTAEIRSVLRADGHQVGVEYCAEAGVEREHAWQPDLLVTADAHRDSLLVPLAEQDGMSAAPLLILEPEGSLTRTPQLAERLVDRLAGPYTDEELLSRVDAWVRVRRELVGQSGPRGRQSGQHEDERRSAWKQWGERIWSALQTRFPRSHKPIGPYLEVAARVANWAESRDVFTPGHAERVATLCALMGRQLELTSEELATLLRAAVLHDIGKAALPERLLHQAGPLRESQMRRLRTHTETGAGLLQALAGEERIVETVRFHHERPDGQGYYRQPDAHVSASAKVLAVAEVFDAMTTSTQRRLTRQQALEQMQSRKGTEFDADCVHALLHGLQSPQSAFAARGICEG